MNDNTAPVSWFHRPRIISAALNVVFWTFFRAKICSVVCHAYCFCWGGTNMARKNVWKPHSIRLLRWFNFSQSRSRKNNRKAFEGAFMEQTSFFLNDDSVRETNRIYREVHKWTFDKWNLEKGQFPGLRLEHPDCSFFYNSTNPHWIRPNNSFSKRFYHLTWEFSSVIV